MNGSTTTTSPSEARLRGTQKGHIRPGDKNDVIEDGFVRLKPRTHDISLIGSHVPSIERVAADINEAVQAVWPKRHEIRYSKVHVLLLSWEDDDLGVDKEIKDLKHVFEKRYRFGVEEHKISSDKPIKNVQQRIYSLLELDGKDKLLVVYYAGHARPALQSNEGSIWFPNRDDPSIAVPSGGVQSLLEEADADVLLLYDCCHSASAPTCHLQVAKGGRTESIAACGFGEVAAEVDDHSFTKALTHTLVLASKQPPFTVGELHARILSQLKCWSAPLARDQDGNHTDRLEPQRRKTPIYSILSETKPRRSIVLGPLPPPTHQLQNNESDSPGSSSAGSTTSTPSSSSGESLSKKRKVTCDESDKCAQVLVIARVDHADLNTEEWANWIREMPSDGKEVHVEGRWDSFSTLLLLRMPVPVWNLLPDSPAYDFVGFVTSKNWATVQGTRLFESASAYQKSDAGRGSFPKSSTAVLGAGPVVMGDENLKDMKIERMDETPIQISGDLTPECENCRSNGLKCDGLKPCWGCTSSDMKCVQFLRRQQSKRRREPSPNLGFDFESTRRSLPDRPSQYNVEASGEELIGPKNNSESTSPECFVDPDWEAETMGLLKDMRIQLRDAETKSDTGIHPPESGPYLGSTLTPLVAVLTAAKAALTGASIIGSGLAGRSVEKAAEARTSGRAAKEGNPSSEALSWVKEYGDDTSSSTSRKDSQTNSRSTGLGGSIISGDNLSTSSATSTQHNPSSSTQSRNHGLNGQHGRGKSNMSQATQWYYVWICDYCWNSSGMTTHNVTHCPECNHPRCGTCPVELKKVRSHR